MKDGDRVLMKQVSAPAVPPSIEVSGLYLGQSEEQIQNFVEQVGYVTFLRDLYDEITHTYQDPDVSSLDRGDAFERDSDPLTTFEIMGCRAPDFVVTKRIGSDPRRRDQGLPTVYGDMSCLETQSAILRLECPAAFLTALRTATTSVVVIEALNPKVETLLVIGAGEQGAIHAFAMGALSSTLQKIYLQDVDSQRAAEAAAGLTAKIKEHVSEERAAKLNIEAVDPHDTRLRSEADAIVTATYGAEEVLDGELKDNMVIAAVGADLPDAKRELSLSLYEEAKFVADDLRQCLYEGELQHAFERLGISRGERVAIEHRGKLAHGRVIGLSDLLEEPDTFRQRPERLAIYDSSGWAGQDLAVARVLLRHLIDAGIPAIPWGRPARRQSILELLGRS
jgi:ornithine cyclodeaminase/alanine dehydrogenase-like protein (mu-crystallin family)